MNTKYYVFLVVLSCVVSSVLSQLPVPVLIGFSLSTSLLGVSQFSIAILSNLGGVSVSLPVPLGLTLSSYGYSKYDGYHKFYVANNINPPSMTYIDNSGLLPKINRTVALGNIKVIGHHAFGLKLFSVVAAFDNTVNSPRDINIYTVSYHRKDIRLLYSIGIHGNWTFQSKTPMFVTEYTDRLYLVAKNNFTGAGGVFVYKFSSGQLIKFYNNTGAFYSTLSVTNNDEILYGGASNGYIMKYNLTSGNGTVLTQNWCTSTMEEPQDNMSIDLYLGVNKVRSLIKCNGFSRLYTYDIDGNSLSYTTSLYTNVMGIQSLS